MLLDNEQYRIIVESTPNMIWRSGTDTLCNYFNKRWLEFTGRSIEQEIGTGWAQGVHEEDYDACLRTYLDAFAKREPFEMEYRLKRKDGVWRWVNDRGVPYYINDREFAGYIGSCMDVTDKIEGRMLRDLAQKDGLTGIFNRQYFEQLAEVQFLKAKRLQSDLCIVMIDINEFKKINDNYGHLTGDLVLKEVAKTISENIRDFDIFGRFGGDEFILLMSDTNRVQAAAIVRRLQNLVRKIQFKQSDNGANVSACFGIYQMQGEQDLIKVIMQADKKLYERKRSRLKRSS